jgi:hypothetical protein
MVAEEIAVGVPVIAHAVLSRERPSGSRGLDEHEVTEPPPKVGVTAVIDEPLV